MNKEELEKLIICFKRCNEDDVVCEDCDIGCMCGNEAVVPYLEKLHELIYSEKTEYTRDEMISHLSRYPNDEFEISNEIFFRIGVELRRREKTNKLTNETREYARASVFDNINNKFKLIKKPKWREVTLLEALKLRRQGANVYLNQNELMINPADIYWENIKESDKWYVKEES